MNHMQLTPIGEAFDAHGVARMSAATRRRTIREIEKVQAQVAVADMREQGRALLTSTALQNVGALSALEQHLSQVAPTGAARYRAIVDAYAIGASITIQRW
jgi:hypothetical protein